MKKWDHITKTKYFVKEYERIKGHVLDHDEQYKEFAQMLKIKIKGNNEGVNERI